MCVESMEEPQQAAPGMVFSARARSGIPHTESGVNKDSQEPRVRGEGTEKKSWPREQDSLPSAESSAREQNLTLWQIKFGWSCRRQTVTCFFSFRQHTFIP